MQAPRTTRSNAEATNEHLLFGHPSNNTQKVQSQAETSFLPQIQQFNFSKLEEMTRCEICFERYSGEAANKFWNDSGQDEGAQNREHSSLEQRKHSCSPTNVRKRSGSRPKLSINDVTESKVCRLPRILECNHTFCHSCIEKLVESKGDGQQQPPSPSRFSQQGIFGRGRSHPSGIGASDEPVKASIVIKCPKRCHIKTRENISNLRINQTLIELSELLGQNQQELGASRTQSTNPPTSDGINYLEILDQMKKRKVEFKSLSLERPTCTYCGSEGKKKLPEADYIQVQKGEDEPILRFVCSACYSKKKKGRQGETHFIKYDDLLKEFEEGLNLLIRQYFAKVQQLIEIRNMNMDVRKQHEQNEANDMKFLDLQFKKFKQQLEDIHLVMKKVRENLLRYYGEKSDALVNSANILKDLFYNEGQKLLARFSNPLNSALQAGSIQQLVLAYISARMRNDVRLKFERVETEEEPGASDCFKEILGLDYLNVKFDEFVANLQVMQHKGEDLQRSLKHLDENFDFKIHQKSLGALLVNNFHGIEDFQKTQKEMVVGLQAQEDALAQIFCQIKQQNPFTILNSLKETHQTLQTIRVKIERETSRRKNESSSEVQPPMEKHLAQSQENARRLQSKLDSFYDQNMPMPSVKKREVKAKEKEQSLLSLQKPFTRRSKPPTPSRIDKLLGIPAVETRSEAKSKPQKKEKANSKLTKRQQAQEVASPTQPTPNRRVKMAKSPPRSPRSPVAAPRSPRSYSKSPSAPPEEVAENQLSVLVEPMSIPKKKGRSRSPVTEVSGMKSPARSPSRQIRPKTTQDVKSSREGRQFLTFFAVQRGQAYSVDITNLSHKIEARQLDQRGPVEAYPYVQQRLQAVNAYDISDDPIIQIVDCQEKDRSVLQAECSAVGFKVQDFENLCLFTGGTNSQTVSIGYKTEKQLKICELATLMKHRRAGHCLVNVGNRHLFALGGKQSGNKIINNVEMIDLVLFQNANKAELTFSELGQAPKPKSVEDVIKIVNLCSWQQRNSMKTYRAHFGAVSVGPEGYEKILIYGNGSGKSVQQSSFGYLQSPMKYIKNYLFEIYDIQSNLWKEVPIAGGLKVLNQKKLLSTQYAFFAIVPYRKKMEDDEKTSTKVVEDQLIVLQSPTQPAIPTEVYFASFSEKFKVTLKNEEAEGLDKRSPTHQQPAFLGKQVQSLHSVTSTLRFQKIGNLTQNAKVSQHNCVLAGARRSERRNTSQMEERRGHHLMVFGPNSVEVFDIKQALEASKKPSLSRGASIPTTGSTPKLIEESQCFGQEYKMESKEVAMMEEYPSMSISL